MLLIPIVVSLFVTGGNAPWPIIMIDAFGWLSGLGSLVLIRCRQAFLRQSTARQRVWALGAWALHLSVFFTSLLVVVFLN